MKFKLTFSYSYAKCDAYQFFNANRDFLNQFSEYEVHWLQMYEPKLFQNTTVIYRVLLTISCVCVWVGGWAGIRACVRVCVFRWMFCASNVLCVCLHCAFLLFGYCYHISLTVMNWCLWTNHVSVYFFFLWANISITVNVTA